jgi:hypothetical protein
MTPIEKAVAWYEELKNPVPFEEILFAHCALGRVVEMQDVFIMARPVRHDWPDDRMCDPWDVATPHEADCWHVYLAAGDWLRAVAFAPYALPWVSWHRRGQLHVWQWRKLMDAKWRRDRKPANLRAHGITTEAAEAATAPCDT